MYAVPLVEGLTAKQWLEQLHNNPVLEHRNLNIEQWVSSKQWSPNSMEGRLLPDTYSVSRGTSIQTVLNQAASALDSYLMSAWQDRQENLPYSSPYEALIMASIIEKETGVAEAPAHSGSVCQSSSHRDEVTNGSDGHLRDGRAL